MNASNEHPERQPNSPLFPLPFEGFLDELRRRGFTVGVDHHVRLQRVLEAIGHQCGPQELSTLLCPLFATNQEQQELFHRIFQSHFALYSETPREVALEATFDNFKEIRRKNRLITATVLLMSLLAWATVSKLGNFPYYSIRTHSWEHRRPPKQAGGTHFDVNRKPATIPGPVKIAVLPAESDHAPKTEGKGNSKLKSNGSVKNANSPKSPPSVPERSMAYTVKRVVDWTRNAGTWLTKSESTRKGFGGLLMLLATAGLLLLRRRINVNKRLLLDRQQQRRPPLHWPIKVPPTPQFFDAEQLWMLARILRQHVDSEHQRLHIESTVTATVSSLGFPTFQYRADLRIPEYLFLIQRKSPRDHQAQMFRFLAEALRQEEIPIDYYYFDDDPRILSHSETNRYIRLDEVHRRHPKHRLLIFSEGLELVDAISGKLSTTALSLEAWPERAVLSPRPPRDWGHHERTLAHAFSLAPATLTGLTVMAEQLEWAITPDCINWFREQNPSFTNQGSMNSGLPSLPLSAPLTNSEFEYENLHTVLSPNAFTWVCACAVYPELQWELTLHLAELSSMPPNLINENNLMQLCRLPAFRAGKFSPELQLTLLKELPPKTLQEIRFAIVRLLEQHPAPRDSFAYDEYILTLRMQKWLSQPTSIGWRDLTRLLQNSPKNHLRDGATLRMLCSGRFSAVAWTLPHYVAKHFLKSKSISKELATKKRQFNGNRAPKGQVDHQMPDGMSPTALHLPSQQLLMTRPRLELAFYTCGACLLIFMGRLTYLQWGGEPEKSLSAPIVLTRLPRRADILTRDGTALAVTLDEYTVSANPRGVAEKEKMAKLLASAIGGNPKRFVTLMQKESKPDGSPNYYVRLAKRVPKEKIDALKALQSTKKLKSKVAKRLRREFWAQVRWDASPRRHYPLKSLACQLVGYTTPDGNGVTGLEAAWNSELSGKPESVVSQVDAADRPMPMFVRDWKPPVAGRTIVTTIDRQIQSACDEALTNILTKYKPKLAVAVVMDPRTGEVVAMSSAPSFDLNNPDDSTNGLTSNRCLQYAYEPGQTFKIITAAAAIENVPDWQKYSFHCAGSQIVGKHNMHCWISSTSKHMHGDEDLSESIRDSCNFGMYGFARLVGNETMLDYAKKFGLGQRVHMANLRDHAGWLPQTPKQWSPEKLANFAVGQGLMLTPFQLTRVAATIANDGVMMKPMLIKELRDESGTVVESFKPEVDHRAIKIETAREVHKMMERVTVEGTARKFVFVPGYTTAAKTGSAQKPNVTGGYSTERFIASLVGFVPSQSPRYTILVMADEPHGSQWGSEVCGPAFAKIATESLRLLRLREGANAPAPDPALLKH